MLCVVLHSCQCICTLLEKMSTKSIPHHLVRFLIEVFEEGNRLSIHRSTNNSKIKQNKNHFETYTSFINQNDVITDKNKNAYQHCVALHL